MQIKQTSETHLFTPIKVRFLTLTCGKNVKEMEFEIIVIIFN